MQVETCNQCPSLYGLGQSGGFWGDLFSDLAKSWSKTGQQILLNQNPAPIYESSPGRTVIYQPNQPGTVGPIGYQRPYTPIENVASSISTTTVLVIGAVVVIALIMSKGD
jgi:hypothetical protein